MTLDKVAGIEMNPNKMGRGTLDTSDALDPCNRCGAPAGFRPVAAGPHPGLLRAECSNTSCAIATPYHYRTREDAAYAWNRKPGDPPKRSAT